MNRTPSSESRIVPPQDLGKDFVEGIRVEGETRPSGSKVVDAASECGAPGFSGPGRQSNAGGVRGSSVSGHRFFRWGAAADVQMPDPVLPREEVQTAEHPVVAHHEIPQPVPLERRADLGGTEVADDLEREGFAAEFHGLFLVHGDCLSLTFPLSRPEAMTAGRGHFPRSE